MKKLIILAISCLACFPLGAAGSSSPLSEGDIQTLLSIGTASAEILPEIERRGYFGGTYNETLSRLKNSGADISLLLALKNREASGTRATLPAAEAERTPPDSSGELGRLHKELVDDTEKRIGSELGIEGSSKRLQEYGDEVGRVLESSGGEAARIGRASKPVYSKLQERLAAYESAFSALNANGFHNAAGITSKSALKDRQDKVTAFARANEGIAEVYKTAVADFRAALELEGVQGQAIEDAAKGFERSCMIDLNLKVRDCDRRLADRMGEVLALYGREWGKWKMSTDGTIRFNSDNALEAYNKAQASIQAIAAEQEAAQRGLIANAKKNADQKSTQADQPVKKPKDVNALGL